MSNLGRGEEAEEGGGLKSRLRRRQRSEEDRRRRRLLVSSSDVVETDSASGGSGKGVYSVSASISMPVDPAASSSELTRLIEQRRPREKTPSVLGGRAVRLPLTLTLLLLLSLCLLLSLFALGLYCVLTVEGETEEERMKAGQSYLQVHICPDSPGGSALFMLVGVLFSLAVIWGLMNPQEWYRGGGRRKM